jgi:hypothetical protein
MSRGERLLDQRNAGGASAAEDAQFHRSPPITPTSWVPRQLEADESVPSALSEAAALTLSFSAEDVESASAHQIAAS